ncbi:beta-xylosidase [Klebsiella pneumoniae]|nr:beta-xylosidase [Klebsiella pneumoniae]
MSLLYQNPVIHADYADPDVIRTGDNFWMVSSSFNQVPGLPLLHSRDLIHVPWQEFSHFVRRPLRQHAKDISKVSFRIDTVQPARSDQSIQQSSALTAMIAAEEDVVLFTQTYRP